MVNFDALGKYDKITFVLQYLTIAESTIGVFGNTLAFIVFSRKRLSKYSFSFYNRARSLADLIILLHAYRHWAGFNLDANIDLTSSIMCKLGEYTAWSNGSISVWLLAITALDRLVTIVYPNKFAFIRERRTQFVLVLLILFYSVTVHISMFIYTDLNLVNTTNGTVKTCGIQDPNKAKIVFWINMMDQMTGVFLVNNVLAFFIIYNVYKSRDKFRQAIKDNKENRTAARDRKFAINSIVLNLKCFILKAPLLLISVMSPYLDMTPDALNMLFILAVLLYFFECSCAIFVDLTVNQLFFDEFMSIFRPNVVSPSTVSTTNQSKKGTTKLTNPSAIA